MDKRIIPEMKSTDGLAYFYMPPMWIGKSLSQREITESPLSSQEIVYTQQLECGLKVRVYRDGVFEFEFQSWEKAAPVIVPAYEQIAGEKVPAKVRAAEQKAEQHRKVALRVMNAHLARMSTAVSRKQGMGMWIRQLITPSSYFTTDYLYGIRRLVGLEYTYDPMMAYVWSNSSILADQQGQRERYTLEIPTIEYSLEILNRIINFKSEDMLLMTNILYQSAISYSNHDFVSTTLLAWAVCEKLIGMLWEKFVFLRHSNCAELNRDRRNSFKERDFTASIMTEVLERSGFIDGHVYSKLTKARKIRNDWMHKLEEIEYLDALDVVQVAERLIRDLTEIDLSINLSVSSRV